MIRLTRIAISGFRGVPGEITIDLGRTGRSIAIFGENAAGKSSISDSIEWFYKDRVEHLWRENWRVAAQSQA